MYLGNGLLKPTDNVGQQVKDNDAYVVSQLSLYKYSKFFLNEVSLVAICNVNKFGK
ncbi:MAG: hypothetical protein GAK29_00997 [Acinetobacter bereziniae]|uniref:Uncharacterized protein n=1 Tax=Acinetobacter bereziniae TaxID=106648 RepID=A0A833URN5_ACIBZ|nr:MAG: hypothetical protein GAK29_00997 [Acinetobacter bereziniae]